jgi:hypothetical protein
LALAFSTACTGSAPADQEPVPPRVVRTDQGLQLRALDVLARGVIGEDPVERHLLELPLRILIERADAHIADALTQHGRRKCQGEI